MKKTAKNFFSSQEEELILNAIRAAEKETSGEIRVHLETTTHKKPVMDRAAYIFKRINMHETKDRNGVLFYLAVCNKQFAILGDKGINAKVPESYWEDIKDDMQVAFVKGNFAEGLAAAIRQTGKMLITFFPYTSDDENELSDEISYDE